ncbi:MAG TPA: hypothetical protein H9737_02360, partial [Candidatus Borkfalkia faecigallinarum]|nr:hypothetical protein [Candidatus Borkfalkia faecigallinarum]
GEIRVGSSPILHTKEEHRDRDALSFFRRGRRLFAAAGGEALLQRTKEKFRGDLAKIFSASHI